MSLRCGALRVRRRAELAGALPLRKLPARDGIALHQLSRRRPRGVSLAWGGTRAPRKLARRVAVLLWGLRHADGLSKPRPHAGNRPLRGDPRRSGRFPPRLSRALERTAALGRACRRPAQTSHAPPPFTRRGCGRGAGADPAQLRLHGCEDRSAVVDAPPDDRGDRPAGAGRRGLGDRGNGRAGGLRLSHAETRAALHRQACRGRGVSSPGVVSAARGPGRGPGAGLGAGPAGAGGADRTDRKPPHVRGDGFCQIGGNLARRV